MGTIFRVYVDADLETAQPAVMAALSEIERLEDVLSEWRDDSEISEINRSAGVRPVKVSDEVFAVIEAGVKVSEWSGGAFDLSWAALRGLYSFDPDHPKIPSLEELRPRLDLIDYKEIELDSKAKTVFLKKKGMAIGTGAIAKAMRSIAPAEYSARGIENYMIFGGGQVQVHGQRRDDRPWRVGIQHPRSAEHYFGSLESEGASFSTSGDYENVIIDRDGKRWHHIIDTKTGLPADKTMSVTVVSSSGIYADALSTAAFVLGPERALKMFESLPIDADLVIVGIDCVFRSSALKKSTFRTNEELGADVANNKALPLCNAER
ncbi:MAG: FAD:protein FMN transferase [Polyangiales bacterium]